MRIREHRNELNMYGVKFPSFLGVFDWAVLQSIRRTPDIEERDFQVTLRGFTSQNQSKRPVSSLDIRPMRLPTHCAATVLPRGAPGGVER
jgi:hypothetical protein